MARYLSNGQTNHKAKLIQMAIKVGGSGPGGWTLAKVSKCFQHGDNGFMEMDVVVVRKERGWVTALCTRSLAVVDLPDNFIDNFQSLEDPFYEGQLVLPDR